MADRRLRKLFRDVWLHKARCAVVVIAIAVGVAGAGIVLNAWALVEIATREGYRASNPAAATLRTDSITPAILARARAVPGVADAQARRTILGRARAQGVWRTAQLFVLDSTAEVRIGLIKPEVGEWPARGGEIVVERSSLEFSGAAVGQPIPLAAGRDETTPSDVLVTGVARDVGLAPGWMEHVVYGFVNQSTARILGARTDLDELQITVSDATLDRDAIRRIAYAVKADLESAGRTVRTVDVPEPGEHIHAAQMDSLLVTQGAFGVLALILSGFLVVNLITAMLTGQVREIGVMKAIGARTEQLAVMYLALAAVLGLAATAIAIPVASILGSQYAALRAELLNFDIAGYSVPWWVTGSQLLAGLVLPLLAAAVPVRHGCRIPVSTALRDVGVTEPSISDDSMIMRVLRTPAAFGGEGANRLLLLGVRNAFRKRQRLVLTLLTLAAGGAVFLGARNLKAAIAGSLDLVYGPHRYDLTVRLDGAHGTDSIEAIIRGVAGVDAAEAWSSARAAITYADGTLGTGFPLIAPPAGSPLLALPAVDGRWLTASDADGIVVSRGMFMADSSLTVGRRLTLTIQGRSSSWTIVGVAEGGPGAGAWALRESVARAIGDARVNLAVVRFSARGEATMFDAIRRVREALNAAGHSVATTQLLAEARRVTEDHLLLVAEFLGAMAWLMIVVGGLGLASTMSLSVLERTREIGVLRAIGASHRDILALVQVEGLLIAVLSWLVALPLSIPMSLILGRVFGSIFFPVPDRYVPEGTGVIVWLGLAVAVAAVASLVPSLKATRVTTATALAYE